MIFKNFRVNITIRILLLTASILGFVFLIFKTSYHITPFLFAGVIIYQVSRLIYYVDKVNCDLGFFLEAIKYHDFTRRFQVEGMGASFDDLVRAFNQVIEKFQELRSEKEEQYYYLQNVVQHIGISLIAYRKDGKVELINNAAKRLFGINRLTNIKALQTYSPELHKTLVKLQADDKVLVKIQESDDLLQLAIYSTQFKLRGHIITLVSIQNIQQELEEQEMQAWQKLIRVLTHEIMNSITPISSLSSTVGSMLNNFVPEECPENFDKEAIGDIQEAIATIHRRSDGLLHFVETYRNLARIPKPNFTIFSVRKLFQEIRLLMKDEIRLKNIRLFVDLDPESLELTADLDLIEQVLINLVKNAVHALEGRPNAQIDLKAFIGNRGRVTLQVIDNGPGILQDVIDKIFIPFFTTKAEGSGIGLSLSRQIIRLHGGAITANSEQGKGTIFTIRF